MVDMAQEEIVHWSVPVAGVLVETHTIPPRTVEPAVGEARDLSEDIEKTFPDYVPGEKLLKQHRKQHVADYPRELFPAFV